MAYTNENQQLMQKLSGEISKVIKGKGEAVQLILTALLAQGHVLIEDVPGVGKTTLAMALGKATGLSFRRAQFTPDVMASDITGFTMFNREENRFEYRSGLVMTNILLADQPYLQQDAVRTAGSDGGEARHRRRRGTPASGAVHRYCNAEFPGVCRDIPAAGGSA